MIIEEKSNYLTDATILSNGQLVLMCGVAYGPEAGETQLLYKENTEWKKIRIKNDLITSIVNHAEGFCLLSEDGYLYSNKNIPLEKIVKEEDLSTKVLPVFAEVMSITAIDNDIIVGGMDGQLYDVINNNVIKKEIDLPKISSFDIMSISGFSKESFYMVGMKGWICYWNGSWNKAETQTELHLTTSCIGSDKKVYASGYNGILIKGYENNWEVVTELNNKHTIWSIVNFKGHIYAATSLALYKLVDNEWIKLDLPDTLPPSYHKLKVSPNNEFLISIGELKIALFDGESWEVISTPFMIEA